VNDLPVAPASRPVRGTFVVPPSKSIHQRALLLSALADRPCRVEVLASSLVGEDVRALERALAAVGRWEGSAWGASRASLALHLGLGATGFRFAVAAATLRPAGARTLVRGGVRLLRRPHGALLRALRRVGARVKRRHSGAFRVLGGGVAGGELALGPGPTSQHASALLLIAPRTPGLALRLPERQVSRPYVALTIDALRAFGASVEVGEWIRVQPGLPGTDSCRVPPDASAAAAWWAAAALTGGAARVEGLARASPQPDMRLLDVLERMGAEVVDDGRTAEVRGRGALVAAGDVDLCDAPDLLPLVAVLAATAAGRTTLHGVAHARAKESDRVARVGAALAAMGARVEEREDGLVVEGTRLAGARIVVKDDHRLAFAFGVLGLAVPGVVLAGADVAVGKSHPGFLGDLARVAGGAPGDG
jgi:3-phosphoshikimate 1-carboxyvinyltransferase